MNTFENREGMDVSRASFFWAGSMDGHQKSHLNGICQRNLRPSCPKWGDKVPDFLLGSLPPPPREAKQLRREKTFVKSFKIDFVRDFGPHFGNQGLVF